jgi:sigma-B regulation protein RsbU (phosphoserine phosphatase)
MSEERLFEIRFPAIPDRLQMVRASVKRAAETVGCDDVLANRLVLAVDEACINIIQHAYKGDDSGEIVLEILNNGSQIQFRLTDFADPIDLECVKPRDLDDLRPGGLGTYFIKEIMDVCEMGHLEGGKGNYCKMIKDITNLCIDNSKG